MFYVHRVPGSNPGGTIFIFMVILNRTDKRRKINKIKQEKRKKKKQRKKKKEKRKKKKEKRKKKKQRKEK